MLSKTTENYAIRRDLDVTNAIENHPNPLIFAMNTVWIWEASNSHEPLVMYIANDDGTFSFLRNIYLAYNIVMEIPAHIRDEKHLREVLDFIAKELK